jgi:hypothetical protein
VKWRALVLDMMKLRVLLRQWQLVPVVCVFHSMGPVFQSSDLVLRGDKEIRCTFVSTYHKLLWQCRAQCLYCILISAIVAKMWSCYSVCKKRQKRGLIIRSLTPIFFNCPQRISELRLHLRTESYYKNRHAINSFLDYWKQAIGQAHSHCAQDNNISSISH